MNRWNLGTSDSLAIPNNPLPWLAGLVSETPVLTSEVDSLHDIMRVLQLAQRDFDLCASDRDLLQNVANLGLGNLTIADRTRWGTVVANARDGFYEREAHSHCTLTNA